MTARAIDPTERQYGNKFIFAITHQYTHESVSYSRGEYRTVGDFDRKTKKAIESVVGDRVRFVLTIDCRDAFVIGKTRRATKLVLTEHRLIVFHRGVIRQQSRDFPRDRIASIEFEKGLLFGKLVINDRRTTDRDELSYRVYAESGRRFANPTKRNQTIPTRSRTKSTRGSVSSEQTGIDRADGHRDRGRLGASC